MTTGFLHLSLPSLEWLAEDRGLETSEASPLRFLAGLPRQSTAARRAEAAAAEGLTPGDAGEGWDEAIEILAKPDAQLGLLLLTPPRATGGAAFYIRADRAARFHLEPEGCRIGRPVSLDSLAETLAPALAGPGTLEGATEAILWPGVLAVLTLLWPLSKRDLSMAVPREEALARLGASPLVAGKAPAVLAELVHEKTLRAANREFTVHPRWRPWLEASWSGHVCELIYQRLAPAAGTESSKGQRLLFVGEPGRRLRSQHTTSRELAKGAGSPGDAAAPEARAIRLTSLTAEGVRSEVRTLLAATPPS